MHGAGQRPRADKNVCTLLKGESYVFFRNRITEFTPDMAQAVHENSLDEDNRRFVPDEVFETVEDAAETIDFLASRYGGSDGPFVYPVLLKDGTNIGYVQAVPLGYATEAVKAFLPVIMKRIGLAKMAGICLAENIASQKVMEKCGFVLAFRGIDSYQGEPREICRYWFEVK